MAAPSLQDSSSTTHRPNKHKRRTRSWEILSRGVLTFAFFGVNEAADSSQFGQCITSLQGAAGTNQSLGNTEYSSVLSDVSSGLISDFQSTPQSFQNLFLEKRNAEGRIDISTMGQDALAGFCSSLYDGLYGLLSISIGAEQCIKYLKDADIEPENGQLETNEYAGFLAAMAENDSYLTSFDELPSSTQESFNDLAIDGAIKGEKGPDFLLSFCMRTLLAIQSLEGPGAQSQSEGAIAATRAPSSGSVGNATVPAVNASTTNGTTSLPTTGGSTLLPTNTSGATGMPTAPTLLPTNGAGQTGMPTAPTLLPTNAADQTGMPTVPTLLPTNAAGQTGMPTVPTLLPTNGVGGTGMPVVLDDSLPGTNLPTPGSSAAASTSGPTLSGGSTIIPTITHTLESPSEKNTTSSTPPTLRPAPSSVVPTPSPSGTATTSPPTILPTIIQETGTPTIYPTISNLSLKDFNACKIGLIVSDLNRNDRLEPQEFVRLVFRLAGDKTRAHPAYRDVDPIFHSAYDKLSDNRDGEPHLDGTKPGRVATASERENMLNICRVSYNVAEAYKALETNASGSNNGGVDPANENASLTAAFKSQCKTAIVKADLNRDNILTETEYVRFVTRLISPDIFSRASTFRQLDPAFKDSFQHVASKNGITVAGSRPGETSSLAQRKHLDSICQAANTAIRTVEKNGGVFASAVPTPSPTINREASSSQNEQFRVCKTAMLIADMDRNDSLSKTEFVRLLNRLTYSEFVGMSFAMLDPILQLAFYKIADNKSTINVRGSKPGSKFDRTTMLHLQEICRDIRTALVTFNAMEVKPKGPLAPVAPTPRPIPTPQPTTSPIGSNILLDCRTTLADSDRDRNFLISEQEFVKFASAMTSRSFSAFEELPMLFRSSYGSAIGRGEAIDLGATNDSAIDDLCFRVLSERGRVVADDCRPSLYAADIDANGRLDEEEYVFFLELFGDMTAADFEMLPYVLQNNWNQIKLDRDYVDVSGIVSAGFAASNLGEQIRLDYICRNSEDALTVVLDGDESLTLEDHCTESLNKADKNGDEFIDTNEFLSLVRLFTGTPWAGVYFDSLDISFRDAFDILRDPDLDMIDVPTGVANGVCVELEVATVETRRTETFFEQCLTAAQHSDEDKDGSLDEIEYITFLFSLAVAYGFVDAIPTNVDFPDLSQVLQLNFEVLAKDSEAISISGMHSSANMKPAEFDNLRWVCQSTNDVVGLITSSEDTSTKVYNSFIVSNQAGLAASDIQSTVEWEALQLAYIELVQDQVSLLKSTAAQKLRKRRLRVDGVDENSVKLYHIKDVRCPAELAGGSKCQVVFGAFDLLVSDEASPETISQHYSQEIQMAIDKGALNLKLLLLAASSPLSVEKSSTPTRPVDGSVFAFSGSTQPTAAPIEEKGSMFLTLLAGASVSLALFCTCYYWFFHIRKSRKILDKTGTGIDGSETYYPPERSEKSSSGANEFSVDDLKPDSYQQHDDDHYIPSPHKLSPELQTGSNKGDPDLRRQSPSREKNRDEAAKDLEESDSSSVDFLVDDSDSSASSALLPLGIDSDKGTRNAMEDSVSSGSQRDQTVPPASPGDQLVPDYLSAMSSAPSPYVETEASKPQYLLQASQGTTSKGSVEEAGMVDVASDFSESSKTSAEIGNGAFDLGAETKSSVGEQLVSPDVSFGSEDADLTDNDESIVEEEEEIASPSSPSFSEEEVDSLTSNNEEPVDEDDAFTDEDSLQISDHDKILDDPSCGADLPDCEEELVDGGSFDEDDDNDGTGDFDEAETLVNSTVSINSKDAYEAYEMYRPIVEDLVRQVVPDEIDNVDTMMEQFIGRERELVRTLRNMAGIEDSTGDDEFENDDEFDDDDESGSYYSEGDGSSTLYGDGDEPIDETSTVDENSLVSEVSDSS